MSEEKKKHTNPLMEANNLSLNPVTRESLSNSDGAIKVTASCFKAIVKALLLTD